MIDFGRSQVEKSHSWDLGFVPSLFQLEMFGWITRDQVRPLGGKYRTICWEGRGVVLASRHLQGCSPRLCWLRTNGLAPASKYWTYRSHDGDMGPVSLVAYHQQKLDLSILLHWLAWKRNWVRTHGSVSRRAMDYVRSPNLSMTRERLPRTGTAHRKHTPGVCGLAWEAYVSCWLDFLQHGVHRFESPQLSNMSNRLFVIVFT
jgi:hypothetical protein